MVVLVRISLMIRDVGSLFMSILAFFHSDVETCLFIPPEYFKFYCFVNNVELIYNVVPTFAV